MSKIIDLSRPIDDNHWRWTVKISRRTSFDTGDHTLTSVIDATSMHVFTHIESALHVNPNSPPIDQIELDRFVGEASIIDLTHIKDNQEIMAKDLKANGSHVKEGDIIILRSDRDLKCPFNSKEFWDKSPFVGEDGARWLLSKKPKVVGFDFPQDYVIRIDNVPDIQYSNEEHKKNRPKPDEYTCHVILESQNDIVMLEYLTNLSAIKKNRVEIIALPLKLVGCEASLSRVIAIER